MTTIQVCAFDDLVEGQARAVKVEGTKVALIRIGDQVYCINDRCSHEDFSLAEGEVISDLCEIECARHGATFDLKTGSPCSLPATTPVATYDVTVTDGMVEVTI